MNNLRYHFHVFKGEKRKAAKDLPCEKMTAKAILKARPGTFRFSDRVIDLEVKTDTTLKNSMTNRQVPCKIGRAFKNDKSESTNGFFDCKVCIIWVKNCLLVFAI